MIFNILIYFLLYSLIYQVPLFAKSEMFNKENYHFKKIGIEQGLSQSSISAITQDDRGYMWFCTATGLNRYDGYDFVVYLNDLRDSLSISDNELKSIYNDKKGYLWIGTSNGILNKFDPKTETFLHYNLAGSSDWFSQTQESYYDYSISFSRNQNSSITTIAEDSQNNLWIGTWGKGIVRFNPETKSKKYFYHFKNKKNSLSSNRVVKIFVDKDDKIWVGTFGGGLNKIEQMSNNEDSLKISTYEIENKKLFGDRIAEIIEDEENNIWIGSFGNGLFKIEDEQRNNKSNEIVFEKINLAIEPNTQLNVMSIVEDKNYNIWISTFGNGLYKYNKNNKTSLQFIENPKDPNSISGNDIKSLFVDGSGVLWIGPQLGSGVNKLELSSNKFNSVPLLVGEGTSLNDNIIWSVLEDSDKNLWFGTYRGGINKWSKKDNSFEYIGKEDGLPDDHIRVIIEDGSENIWIGTYSGGLSYYDKKNSKFTNFVKDDLVEKGINANQIQALYLENDSILWVGTFGGGLNKLDLNEFYKSGKAIFNNYTHNPADLNSISDNRVYKIYEDSKKNFWIGTHGGGLNKFDRENETFIKFKSNSEKRNSLSDSEVMAIQEIKNGNLLIGTFGGGLDVFDPNDQSVYNLNEKIVMNCSDIYGILPDNMDGYWLSTNDGIYKINEDLNSFRKFDLKDGLQSLEFSGGAYFKSSDGTCYFGGINGINYFNSTSFKQDEYIAPIVISRIKVFDNPIKGDKSDLILSREENYFSFEFASLDYEKSGKNKYKYILEGLDNKWSFTDSENRKIFYRNISPGDYTFKVIGTNHDGKWSSNNASVNITILSPFWMQWWFLTSIMILVGSLVFFFIRQRFKYLVALDHLKSKIAADLHDNVGAGLTEISILSELASSELKVPEKATKHIVQIGELSRQLVESMSDIVWMVNPNRDTLHDLIVRLKDTYGELLGDLGINLRTSNLEDLNIIKLPLEYRQNLYLILKETINNSIKHSNCSKIEILISQNRNNINIEISDNGNSFDINNVKFGNGLINIKERANKIGCKLDILSEIPNGTKIIFNGKI